MYEKPGDVKAAVNYRCRECRKVFRTPQGLNGHITKVHKVHKVKRKHWATTKCSAL